MTNEQKFRNELAAIIESDLKVDLRHIVGAPYNAATRSEIADAVMRSLETLCPPRKPSVETDQ